MFVVHAGWLVRDLTATSPGLFLWAEGGALGDAARERHPRSLPAAEVEAFLRRLAVPCSGTSKGPVRLLLPSRHGRPAPSSPSLGEGDGTTDAALPLRPFEVEALVLPPAAALDLLVNLPSAADPRAGAALGDDVDYWAEAGRWAFDLLLRRRVVPASVGGLVRWLPVVSDERERERLARFSSALPPVSRAALPAGETSRLPPAGVVLRAFLEDVVDASARAFVRLLVPAEHRRVGPPEEAALLAQLAAPGESREAGAPLSPALARRLDEWGRSLLDALPDGEVRLGMRLLPPAPGSDDPGPWRLRFHLEAAEDPSFQVDAAEVWSPPEGGALSPRRLIANPEETLLARLGGVASLSPVVARSLERRHPVGLELSLDEAYRFLTREAPLLRDAGVSVLLPADGRISRVSVRLGARGAAKTGTAVTRFGLATLVDFDWRLAIGDRLLSPEEFEEIASRKVPLVDIRGEWVLLDPESVQRTLAIFDRRPSGRTTLGEFLRLAGGLEGDAGAYPVDGVEADGWLGALLSPDEARAEIDATAAPAGFVGSLRPYQLRGVGWLGFLLARGLGACLADDMGLGKTIQLLAALLAAKERGEAIRPSLIVCPTSVAENWTREAARFAPSLVTAVHHGPDRAAGEAFDALVASTDVIVTTYPLAHRDRALLASLTWEYLVLDEAQNVKNAEAAQSRAVRAIPARRRAALTGTPVENRLSELKSILDFLNAGLLGSEETFRREFSIPVERQRDADAAARLRRLTAPFLLRRTKVDPLVAPDLPEKFETKEYVGLSREQATLYRATTRALLEGIGRASGRSRRAKVLLLLLRLKQICNHPALFLGDRGRLENRSVKLERLLELLEETWAERSPALLFTQFAEMGHLLVAALRARFGTEVLFLHGGVPRKARDAMVRRFQEDADPPPFFVLSLRAGGSGLNLTRASHVFHVDRWWNPAVEDQATDRAFRIGQTRHVQVHKFVCRGTLEERIDAMIEDKKDLARSIVGAGEGWLADLSDEELVELVSLGRDAVEDGGRR